MTIFEIFLLSIFCFFQSIFGIGVLIFGTPTFILLGYNYFEVLNILLPYSIVISLLQITFTKKRNLFFFKKIIILSLPMLSIGLILSAKIQNFFNLKYLLATLLIVTSLINLFKSKLKKELFKNINLNFMIIGFIQGISNLGGGFLSLVANNLDKNKILVRYNIASGYFLFAIIQLILVNLFYQKISFDYLRYSWIPLFIFYFSNYLFNNIKDKNYSIFLNVLILVYGIYLLI